jgi:intracellular sulfur oxidation DsrE/DsrF family protein
MKKWFLALCMLSVSTIICAQENKLKVIWDVADADTATTAGVFRQINNALAQVPDLQIEVVFHGQAIFGMVKDSTIFTSRIKAAKEKGVTLAVCNNSLKRYKVDPSKITSDAIIVPSAVVELIRKQSEGWSYLRAGH